MDQATMPTVISFQRGDCTIEVDVAAWGSMLAFLAQCGFISEPLNRTLRSGLRLISAEEALRFAVVGQVVLDTFSEDPMAGCAEIRFDLGKFAEIVIFAEEGGFVASGHGKTVLEG